MLDFFDPPLAPLDGLVRTVKTGEPAFEERHAMPFYDYLNQRDPAGGAQFDASMSVGARMRSHALLSHADFADARVVVDVGGGEGVLLATVLEANPHLRGVVFESEQTAERARARLASRGLGPRAEAVAGDFFSFVPRGGDVYVLSYVLHNWDDARAISILENCRRAMDAGASLFIVEQVHVPTDEASLADYFGLSTIELLGGGERTESEFRSLLERAGLRFTRLARPSDVPFCVLHARAP